MGKTSVALRKTLIEQFGGSCQRCGYNKCTRALHFHHVDNTNKKDYGNRGGATLEEVQEHPERFLILCANCHIEEHDGLDKAKAVIVSCAFCQKEFQIRRYLLNVPDKGKYCSKECESKNREAIAQTEEHITARFWKHVAKKDDCWIWQGTITGGTPVIQMKVKETGKYTFLSTVRFAYEHLLKKGSLPHSTMLRRKCDNVYCVNPDHFELSSEYGSRGAFNKLTDTQVLEIRHKFAQGGYTHVVLASEYGIARETVGQIVRRQRWQHVEG